MSKRQAPAALAGASCGVPKVQAQAASWCIYTSATLPQGFPVEAADGCVDGVEAQAVGAVQAALAALARLDAAAGELVAWRRLRRRRSVLALLEARPLRRRPGGQAVREHRRPSEAGVCATCELACEACACVVQREGSVRGCTCGQRGRFGISADASPFWRRLEIGCPPARLEMLVACTRYLRPHFFATAKVAQVAQM